MNSTREERKFAEWCKTQSGIKCVKLMSPGNAGIPDRVVFMRDAITVFIEFKNKGESLDPLQKYWRKTLYNEMGFDHYVCTTCDQAKAVVLMVRGVITLTHFSEEMKK